ncbi:oxidoreductase [Ureibacillus massiliensis 4400831 = CIP 108448 = CCUG 49529]|uniref:Oxidoreductase n=1 Tax=Ureibacillus massiliensis 4400831 = CIP 108448 = CCUG 49529 TaxID=1211035 RepID=A0A0A3J3Y3_9BACL|nr:aldo/keto reductase [Ureibacillus massiliensis]KGR90405.1 oxidoreductase [Ureibacillus massiliensis 4400831 = CIP 108448 = CCUG 49529]
MKKRTLGNSAIEISELSFGCMSLPTNLKEAKPIIERAIEHGINYFDTADLYDKGVNEKIVGESLKPYRNQIVLATKVGNVWDTDGDTWHWDASPAHIEEGLKNSLARLKTDYIDLYQLHGGTIEDSWDEIIDTFEKLKKEGLIREYGISSIRPNVFKPFLQNSHAVSNMMQYSILDRRPEEWFDFIEDTSSSVVTRGSIAKGLLTSEWKSRLEKSNGYMSYTKEELQQLLLQLEETFGDLHATAIAFNLSHPVIASTVIGARTIEQLDENVKAYKKAQQISDLSIVQEIAKFDKYTDHR